MEAIFNFDRTILLFFQDNIRTEKLTKFFTPITSTGNWGMLPIFVAIVLLMSVAYRKTGIMCAIGLITQSLTVNLLIKPLVNRARPYEVIDGLTSVIGPMSDKSFPSGHSCAAFLIAVILYNNVPKKYGIFSLVIACLIAISRIYMGVHYPTDVICGALIGIIIGITVSKLYPKAEAYFKKDKKATKENE
jgi:undecaprenyl-diphosphatase